MGAALLVTVWITYSGVSDAHEALVRGRAAALQADLREELREIQGRPTDADLQDIVDTYEEDGLRYIGLVRHKLLIASGGKSDLGERERVRLARRLKHGELSSSGDRIQLVLRAAGPRARRRRNRDVKKRDLPAILIEFEPREARALQASSTRSLGTGAGAAVLLWIAALFLLRWFGRQDAARARLEGDRRLASLGQMSAVLAHEIRNPLASLKGNAQLLEKLVLKSGDHEASPAQVKTATKATRVVAEALRLEQLVNDLLEFARSGTLQRSEVDPRRLLQDCVDAVDASSITVDVSSAPESWSLDAARIQQVLNNLLQNAVQASERVEATASIRAGKLAFVVRDHGEGVPEGATESLFEPFHTKKTQGTGLGLAVAKRLVELHGGTIGARNADSGGAEFRVEIPAG
jgi:two-component system sensor histidine kinase HydH